jgi:hypothetical protein
MTFELVGWQPIFMPMLHRGSVVMVHVGWLPMYRRVA